MPIKQHPHGGRQARLIDDSGEAWYHVYNRVACHKDEYPLDEAPEAKSTLSNFIHFYTDAYECQVATYAIMGNHYHLVLKMAPYQKLSEEELQEKAVLFYPNTHAQTQYWLPEHWKAFNRRLFSLPDLMRNIQQGFTRWFNKSQNRRGRLWADRFKSTLLYGEETLLECMQYVDLNPVRAGLVARPEDDEFGAYAKRQKQALPEHFIQINELLHESDEQNAFAAYRTQVYLRGNIASKEGQAEISDKEVDRVLNAPFDLGCPKHGEKRDHLRFFVDGLVMGSKERVERWLNDLRDLGHYKRRKHPKSINDSGSAEWFCLREQRSHFQGG
jgi:REP element-mobilizing transposase RayT